MARNSWLRTLVPRRATLRAVLCCAVFHSYSKLRHGVRLAGVNGTLGMKSELTEKLKPTSDSEPPSHSRTVPAGCRGL